MLIHRAFVAMKEHITHNNCVRYLIEPNGMVKNSNSMIVNFFSTLNVLVLHFPSEYEVIFGYL